MTQPPPIQPARPSLPPAESWLAGVPTPAQQRQDRYAVAAFVTSLPGLVPVAVVLAGVAIASFYGELRARAWRLAAHAGLVVMLAIALWTYWPRK